MTMPTTRTGAKLATEQPPTSDAQRMHAVVMKLMTVEFILYV